MIGDKFEHARRIAIEHPCFLAVETSHPRYGHALPFGSLVVTVNSGYE